jgi:hypothetical protein
MVCCLSAGDRLDDLELVEHRVLGTGPRVEHATGALLHRGDDVRVDRDEVGRGGVAIPRTEPLAASRAGERNSAR